MEESVFLSLIDKYLKGTATDTERRLVDEYYERLNLKGLTSLSSEQELALQEMMLQNIRQRLGKPTPVIEIKAKHKILRWTPYIAASFLLLVVSAGFYFYLNKPVKQQIATHKPVVKGSNIIAGGNKTILTLADGSKIALDDAANGEIAKQPGISIIKATDGHLIYTGSESGFELQNSQLLYNKIETPKGSRYQVNLPDGSKVWLDAASSLRYPAIFTGNDRKVELTGEAYFEISPNKLMPFKIETVNQIVEVLGTHLNINAYPNEPTIKTTLLEGSVKVSELYTNKTQFLKPGEEADNNKNGEITVSPVNTEQTISWKNGNFSFNDMELVNIMRQLERWYDVDVDYSEIPKTRYNAHMSRTLDLSKVLEMLEVTGKVKFTIEDKTIKVSNNQ